MCYIHEEIASIQFTWNRSDILINVILLHLIMSFRFSYYSQYGKFLCSD